MENLAGRVDVRELLRMALLDNRLRNLLHANLAGRAAFDLIKARCIKKEDQTPMARCLRSLGSELVQAQELNFGFGEFAFERLGGTPGDAIVTAQRIAVGDDENAGHICSFKLVSL